MWQRHVGTVAPIRVLELRTVPQSATKSGTLIGVFFGLNMKNKPRIYYLEWDEALYISHTICLSNDEDLIYRRLIGQYFIQKGLPSDTKELCKFARYPQDVFEKCWLNILKLEHTFKIEGDRLTHEFIDERINKIKHLSEVRSAATAAREQKKKERSSNDDQLIGYTDTDTDTDTDITKKKESVKEKRNLQENVNGHDLGAVGVPPQTPPHTKSKKKKKPEPDWSKIENLNMEAWELYLAYRHEVLDKPKYKIDTRARLLAEYPHDVQMEAVVMTCETAGDWTGLFPQRIFNLQTGKRI